jgi:hypothetical protein
MKLNKNKKKKKKKNTKKMMMMMMMMWEGVDLHMIMTWRWCLC